MMRHFGQLVLLAALSLWFSGAAGYLHECQEHLPPPQGTPATHAADSTDHDHDHDGPAAPRHDDPRHDCRLCQALALSLGMPTPPPALPAAAVPPPTRLIPLHQSVAALAVPRHLLARGPPDPRA